MYRAFSGSSKRNMPPIFDRPTTDKYDYVIIGGGSAGSGSSVSSKLIFISEAHFFEEESRFLWQESCCGRGYSIPWRHLC